MMKAIFCLTIAMLLSVLLWAQSQTVRATVDRSAILIGEPIELTLQATLPPAAVGHWFEIDSIPHFEVLKRSKIDSTKAIAGLTLKQTLTITSWDSGAWSIPPLTLLRFRTVAIPIAVGHSPMDYNQPYHNIKDILPVQKSRSSNWYWYLIGIAVLIALFLLFFPPRQKGEGKVVPDVDVYRQSLQRLDALRPDGEAKVFYTELVDVLRGYLHRKKGLQSFSKTTDDLAVQIKQQLKLPGDDYQQLVQTLRLSDAVKFAKFAPTGAENKEALEVVRKTIMMIEGGKG